jgi:DNA-binding transcriptional LysR family regulator
MFELRDLEQFIALVEHRNFGRAATALGMTQPQLSRRIGALERDLGVALFSRAHRQIELTRAGELLLGEARGVLAQAALAERLLRDAARGAIGHLRFGTRSTSQYTLVPAAIRRLREMHPHASVTLTGALPGLQVEHLRQGTIDLTVLRGPVDLEGGLQAALLRTDPLAVGLPEHHRLARRSVVDAADLADEAFVEIAWYQAFGYRELTRGYCARVGFVPRVVQAVDTSDMLAMCVAAGLGIGLMPDTSRELPIPGLVFRPLRPKAPAVDLQAVWRGGDMNPVIPPFVRCLRSEARRFGEIPSGGRASAPEQGAEPGPVGE